MNETIEDVVAAMRQDIANGVVGMWADFGGEIARGYVDRIESACHQPVTDCNALGNAAKMRKALKQIHDRVNSIDEDCGVDPIDVRDLARAALIAPPRNCDVLSKAEVLEMLKDRSFSKEDTIEWLYDEAEGENKCTSHN